MRHRGRTVGYRLENGALSLAFVPDNEPGLDPESGLELATDVDILLPRRAVHRRRVRDARRLGAHEPPRLRHLHRAARPGRAIMFHHDPAHSDEQLEEMEAACAR